MLQDSLRVLEETGIAGPSYPTPNRRLPAWAEESWRQGLSEACAAHDGGRLGAGSIVHTGARLPDRARAGMRQFAVPGPDGARA